MAKKENLLPPTSIRFAPREREILDNLIAVSGKKQQDIIRGFVRGAPPLEARPPLRPVFDQKGITQLNKISNAINQIVGQLNKGERNEVSIDMFKQLDRALMQVIIATTHGGDAAKKLLELGLSEVLKTAKASDVIERDHSK